MTIGPDVIETIPLDRLCVQVTVPACMQSVIICRFDQLLVFGRFALIMLIKIEHVAMGKVA